MKQIAIAFSKVCNMRYETLGDFGWRHNLAWFKIVKMKKTAYTLAVLIHEIVEAFLCMRDGIKEKDITQYDLDHLEQQQYGIRPEIEEPGDASDCPYRAQHQAATSVERAVIAAFDESWTEYENECRRIFNG